MAFTTGTITNTRSTGVAASTVVVNVNNENLVNSANVTIEVFVGNATTNKTLVYLNGFTIPPDTVNIFTFNIAGNYSYEVQSNVGGLSPSDVIISVFGLDEYGNLVQNQKILQAEMSQISQLSS